MAPAAGLLAAAALVLYSVAVWDERREGLLRGRHVWCVGAALACDLWATPIMTVLPAEEGSPLADLMRTCGFLAVALMALHVVVAALVLTTGVAAARRNFHRFSTTVWSIWLVPYLAGALGALVS